MMKCKKCGEEFASAHEIVLDTEGFIREIKGKDFVCRKCRLTEETDDMVVKDENKKNK